MTNIYIECGTTLRSPFNTGIQRVVRNIIDNRKIIESNFPAVELFLVEYINKNFYVVSADKKIPTIDRKKFSKSNLRIFRLVKFILPQKIYKVLAGSVHRMVNALIRQNYTVEDVQKSNPSEEGVLLLLDSTWNNEMWNEVAKFRAAGGSVSAVLYDLIPFTHPETVEMNTRILHTTWWKNAVNSIDSVICISKTVRNDFCEWQTTNSTVQLPVEAVDYFYLGAEIGYKDPVIKIMNSDVPFFLMVGSVEPRKNHSLVLDAFEFLWASGGDLSLVICAGNSWNSEKLLSRIRLHKEFDQRLFLIEKCSDRDLAYLNKSCCAVIMASFAEGYGLPIVEALSLGTRVICNDIPVFREIGLDNVTYFSLNDRDSLSQKIHEHAGCWSTPAHEKKVSVSLLSWEDSATMLVDKVLKLSVKA